MKRLLLVLLALMNFMAMHAIDDFQDGGLYYRHLGADSVAVIAPSWNISYSQDTIVIPEEANIDSTFFFRVTAIAKDAFYMTLNLKHVVIPSSVRVIEEMAFSHSNVESIDFGDGLDSIGSWAFEYCRGLTRLNFPSSLRHIGKSAFRYCTSLDSLLIPNAVLTMNNSAFNGCTSLTTVTIGNGLKCLNSNCFEACSALQKVVLSEGLQTVKSTAFEYCSSLSEINIPVSVNSITAYAFNGCTSLPAVYTNQMFIFLPRTLTSYTVPDGITSICMGAFEGSSLKSIELPTSLTTINWMAFDYCLHLDTVICHALVPPLCKNGNGLSDDDAFQYLPSTAILDIPQESLDMYRTTPGWKNFKRFCINGDYYTNLAAVGNDSMYYATFSSTETVQFANDDPVEVFAVTVDAEGIHLNLHEGKRVPANTGVLLRSTNTTARYAKVMTASAITNNMLYAAQGEQTSAAGDCYYYKLAYGDWTNRTNLGFYWGADDGAAFVATAGGAYLAVPKSLFAASVQSRYIFGQNNTPTALDAETTRKSVSKLIRDGKLYILRDGKAFDVSGRMVK